MTDTGSTMITLIDRLRAAIDEDHAAIEAYIRHREHGTCVNHPGQDPASYDEYDTCSEHIATAEACRYRDPGDGRRMVEAHRDILDLHWPQETDQYYRYSLGAAPVNCGGESWTVYGDAAHFVDWPCLTVRALAKGYGIAI